MWLNHAWQAKAAAIRYQPPRSCSFASQATYRHAATTNHDALRTTGIPKATQGFYSQIQNLFCFVHCLPKTAGRKGTRPARAHISQHAVARRTAGNSIRLSNAFKPGATRSRPVGGWIDTTPGVPAANASTRNHSQDLAAKLPGIADTHLSAQKIAHK